MRCVALRLDFWMKLYELLVVDGSVVHGGSSLGGRCWVDTGWISSLVARNAPQGRTNILFAERYLYILYLFCQLSSQSKQKYDYNVICKNNIC